MNKISDNISKSMVDRKKQIQSPEFPSDSHLIWDFMAGWIFDSPFKVDRKSCYWAKDAEISKLKGSSWTGYDTLECGTAFYQPLFETKTQLM